MFIFFFSSRRRHTRSLRDWSSDVCSSDLDNNFYRRALQLSLEEWGYEVVTAADGEAAWEVLSGDQAPKLAILDWMMPGLNGPDVCRRLRALHRHEPTYVILLTSKGGKENAVEI